MRAFATGTAFAILAVCALGQTIKVGDRTVAFDVQPMERNGIVVVPVRGMVEAMDATMRWDMPKQTLSIWKGHHRFDVVLNSRTAIVDGKTTTMDEPAFLERGRI